MITLWDTYVYGLWKCKVHCLIYACIKVKSMCMFVQQLFLFCNARRCAAVTSADRLASEKGALMNTSHLA